MDEATTDTPPPVLAASASAAAAPEPSILDRAKAILAGGSKNAETINALRAEHTELLASHQSVSLERDQAVELVRKVTVERDEALSQIAELTRLFTESQAKVVTVESAVTDQLAALGVPAAQLPATAPKGEDEPTIEELSEKLTNTSDPAERGQIVTAMKTLRAKATK